MIPILSGNVASALPTGYEVANSCRFDRASSAYLSKTQGAGSRRKATFSCWWKGAYPSAYDEQMFMSSGGDHNCYGAGAATGTMRINTGTGDYAYTNRYFRDPTAWYHMVWAVDTEQSTAADRMKLYINGIQVTSFSHSSYPSEDEDLDMNQTGETFYIARSATTSYGDFMLAEVVWIDGSQLTASSFGEFDEDSPTIWKPKDLSDLSGSKGTNGFYLDFEDSSNLGNDVWGGTDLTASGLAATDQASDSPTNNFCVMNPLATSSYSALSEGNTKTAGTTDSDNGNSIATIVPSRGKWYCECKIGNKQGTGYPSIGMAQASDANFGTKVNSTVGTAGYNYPQSGIYRPDGQKYSDNSTAAFGSGNSFDTNDIMMMAMDCDNGAFYIGKNGSWISDGTDTGDPTSAGSKTGAFLTWTPANKTGQTFATRDFDDGVLLWNFGNPTYANSSSVADANGYGAFEYTLPTGYYALCTKNLAEYG